MGKICFICKKEIDKSDGMHIYRCAKNNNLVQSKNDLKLSQMKFQSGIDINKDLIYEKYISEGWSLVDFEQEFHLNYRETEFLLKIYDIKKRNISESCYVQRKINKSKKSMLEKYGVENASQAECVKQKKKKTFMKNYGVDNIWKSKEYYLWLHEYMITKYGKGSLPNKNGNMQKWWHLQSKDFKSNHMKNAWQTSQKNWYNLTDEEKNKLIQKRCKKFVESYNSSLETRIGQVLDKMQISYERQFWINRKSYDFRLSKTRVIIEVQGDFWHANPLIYTETDILNFGSNTLTAGELWQKDLEKLNNAVKYSYKIIYFWELEIKKLDDYQLLMLVEEKLNGIKDGKD